MDIKPITLQILIDRIMKVLDKMQPSTPTRTQYMILSISFLRLRTNMYHKLDRSEMCGNDLFWDILGISDPKYTKDELLILAKAYREHKPEINNFLEDQINILRQIIK
jgi:hypothetical protein